MLTSRRGLRAEIRRLSEAAAEAVEHERAQRAGLSRRDRRLARRGRSGHYQEMSAQEVSDTLARIEEGTGGMITYWVWHDWRWRAAGFGSWRPAGVDVGDSLFRSVWTWRLH